MIDSEIGQEYLDQFDTLDISEKPQRRVGVYVLKEFYAAVMVEVGRKYLGFEVEMKRYTINKMWGRILARIESLDECSTSDEFFDNGLFSDLKEYRRQSHHNTVYNPPVRQLEELRELAPTWREWLLKNSRKYYEYEEELDPHGTVVEMAKTTLQGIIVKHPKEFESGRAEEIVIEANSLMERLSKHKEENNEITIELINVLKEALALREEMEHEMVSREFAIMDAIEEYESQEYLHQE